MHLRMLVPFIRRFLFAFLLIAVSSLTFGTTHEATPRVTDASNLRQIAQASLIYAQFNKDQLPHADDIWDYAAALANGGGLESASLWQSRLDPATENNDSNTYAILLAGNPNQPFRNSPPDPPRAINPSFRKLKLSVAVPLGALNNAMPSTMPVAWTRGLQPDGTWAAHSPYGPTGGYIAFIGGNVQFFKNLQADGGQLMRFDGKGKTANILDALPPDTRIGEYTPTDAERTAWSIIGNKFKPSGKQNHSDRLISALIAFAIWISAIVLAVFLFKRNIIGAASLIIAIMVLTVLLVAVNFGDLTSHHILF